MIGKHYAEYEHPRSKMESDFAFLAVDWFEVYDCDLDLRFQRHTSHSIIVPNTNTVGQKLKKSSSYEPKDRFQYNVTLTFVSKNILVI